MFSQQQQLLDDFIYSYGSDKASSFCLTQIAQLKIKRKNSKAILYDSITKEIKWWDNKRIELA